MHSKKINRDSITFYFLIILDWTLMVVNAGIGEFWNLLLALMLGICIVGLTISRAMLLDAKVAFNKLMEEIYGRSGS